MDLPRNQVEDLCKNLTPLLKTIIRTKVITSLEPHTYTSGEALVFWLFDWLMKIKIASDTKVRLIIETFYGIIRSFGDDLGHYDKSSEKILPVCKIGICDRHIVCVDVSNRFLDLDTGLVIESIKKQPLETITYNLTTLYTRYANALKKKESDK